jgi:hypothetical protein
MTFKTSDQYLGCIKLCIILICCMISATLIAQDEKPRFVKSIFIEALGQSLTVFSLNLEIDVRRKFRFLDSTSIHPVLTIGYGRYEIDPLFRINHSGFNIPVGLNVIWNEQSNHHLEVGLGMGINQGFGYARGDSGFSRIIMSSRYGYRYQKPEGGLLFRAAVTPLFFVHYFYDNRSRGLFDDLDLYFHVLGVSIGYSF